MYKILISGYYGFNNIGDESILRTVIDNLRLELGDVDLTVLSQNPADTAEKYGVHAVERMKISKIVRAIRGCDMLVFGGGSLLQDATSTASLLYYLFIIRTARFFKKKVLLYSQGIGPIRGKWNRLLTAGTLRGVEEIAVRDDESAALLREIGVPSEKVFVTADPVMGMRKAGPEKGRAILESLGLKKREDRLIVGWAIKAADGDEKFLDEVAASIRWLSETHRVDSVLIPFHYEQDAAVAEALRDRLGEGVFCITEKYLSDEMLSIIGNLDCLVGVRLHSLIFAAIMGVPMIGVSYDPKVDAFMASVGQRCAADTETFTAGRFEEVFAETVAHGEEITASTGAEVKKLKARLETYDKKIKHVIEENTAPAQSEPPLTTEAPPAKTRKKGGVLTAIGGVMLVTVAAKLLGILRESLQANVFGAVDAFYASYNKTIYLFTTIAYAMCVAAVPIITKAMTKGREEGESVANNVITFGLLLSFICLAIWELLTVNPFAGWLWPAGDPAMLSFMRLMALTLPVIVVTYLLVAVFQSMDYFTLQGSMSLPYSVFLILFLIFFAEREAILIYVAAVSVAWLLQFAMTVPYALKERYLYRVRLDLHADYLRFFLKTVIVTIVTTSAYLFCYLIDASAAEGIGPGVTTAFYYADKIFTPLTTTFIYSISVVLFPKLNRHYLKTDHREYLGYVWTITSRTLIAVFPVSAILIVLGGPMVKVLFESGNFTAESTAATTAIFMMYAVGMAGFSVIDLLNKAFFTMNKLLAPFLISLFVIAFNAVLDHIFALNSSLLALSTAAAMTVGAVITIAVVFRGREGRGILRFEPIVKSLLLSLIIGAASWFLRDLLILDGDGKLMLAAKGLFIGAAAMVLFVAGCFLLKVEEITAMVKRKKRGAS